VIASKVTEALVLKGVLTTAPRILSTEEAKASGEENNTPLPPSYKYTRRERIVRYRRKFHYSSMLLGSLGVELYEVEEGINGSGVSRSNCKCCVQINCCSSIRFKSLIQIRLPIPSCTSSLATKDRMGSSGYVGVLWLENSLQTICNCAKRH
jgi:hypothetical protein